jgi:hypothetical protein
MYDIFRKQFFFKQLLKSNFTKENKLNLDIQSI